MIAPLLHAALLSSLALSNTASAASLGKRRSVSGTASVYFNESTGTPQHLASGIIYGIPDTEDQIPDHFYTDVGFNFARAGGAQIDGQGWIDGVDAYEARFASMLSNYNTARKYSASFNLLMHDLWGADSTQSAASAMPGDDGNWTYFDEFMDHFISDINDNNVIDGVIIDIWNEPDLNQFWRREQSQYLDMWGRAFHRLADDLPDVPTSGPSVSNRPNPSSSWWIDWANFVVSNNSVPNQISWHMEKGSGNMELSIYQLGRIQDATGLPSDLPVNINEYAVSDEQVPAGGAWWIAQLERVNAIGLRGNWLSGEALHDFMAGLLGKPDAGTDDYDPEATGYWPAAEFQVYKYYNQEMTGSRYRTSATEDQNGDVYATADDGVARILVGSRVATGTFSVQLTNLEELGLPSSGTLDIQTVIFPGSADHFAEVDAPTDGGSYGHDYSNGTLTFSINQDDVYTAYAFEFSY